MTVVIIAFLVTIYYSYVYWCGVYCIVGKGEDWAKNDANNSYFILRPYLMLFALAAFIILLHLLL